MAASASNGASATFTRNGQSEGLRNGFIPERSNVFGVMDARIAARSSRQFHISRTIIRNAEAKLTPAACAA
jgi:hypothetical protein